VLYMVFFYCRHIVVYHLTTSQPSAIPLLLSLKILNGHN